MFGRKQTSEEVAIQRAIMERLRRANPERLIGPIDDGIRVCGRLRRGRRLWIKVEGDILKATTRVSDRRTRSITFSLAEPDFLEQFERELNSLGLSFDDPAQTSGQTYG